MIVLPDKPIAYFDVDQTLVMWDYNQHDIEKTISIGCDSFCQNVLPHEIHIQKLREHKVRNHLVVVWSQGGSDWAAAVVRALGLEAYVDLVVTKPCWFYDDLKPEQFMQNRYYYPVESK